MDWIMSYHWPGNVRELKNAVERAVIMSRGPVITADDIVPRHLRMAGEVSGPVTLNPGTTLADARRQLVLHTFSMTGGDPERTAKVLGMNAADVRAELAALVNGNGSALEAEIAATRNMKASVPAKEKAPAKMKAKGRR
jgi:two-component system response regulator HydG